MNKRNLCISLVIIVISVFFIGIEVIGREHSTDYDLFIKKHPTIQLTFSNPVLCGECDFKPYKILSTESKSEFKDLCYYRYDLKKIEDCEAKFKY